MVRSISLDFSFCSETLMLIKLLPLFAVFPAHRGSEGSGGDSRAAPEQPDPAGELPEADGAAERLDRYREPDGAGQGESSERRAGSGAGEPVGAAAQVEPNEHLGVVFQEFIREGCLYKLTKKGLQQRMFFLVRSGPL